MATHDLKTWPEPFEALCSGAKRHEIRKDDRGYAVGDTLHLREWEPPREARHEEPVVFGHYTGRGEAFRVTYITRGPEWNIPPGYVVMSVVSIGPISGLRPGSR